MLQRFAVPDFFGAPARKGGSLTATALKEIRSRGSKGVKSLYRNLLRGREDFPLKSAQNTLIHKRFYYPASYLFLDATILCMVQIFQPLSVGICVAPNAVVRTIK
jgi:hypothetical protein